jgi:hypothetical protein
MGIRVPRGFGRYQSPYNETFEGRRPPLSRLGNLLPAPWLPVVVMDEKHNDPVSIEAGTWVGRINATDHSAAYTAMIAAKRAPYLVPANASTGEYTVTYSAYDVDYLTPDVDDTTSTVSAAGASTLTIEAVKPMGIAYQNMYASHLKDTYSNYNRQHMVGFLSWGYAVWLPIRSTNEATIQPGDLLVMDDASHAAGTWKPRDGSNVVGRIRPWVSGDSQEMIVGRCLEKLAIATQTATSANQTLAAAIAASNVTTSTVHNFGDLSKVQTPPGLGLQGSGTLGVPGWLLGATAISDTWYGMIVSVRCN